MSEIFIKIFTKEKIRVKVMLSWKFTKCLTLFFAYSKERRYQSSVHFTTRPDNKIQCLSQLVTRRKSPWLIPPHTQLIFFGYNMLLSSLFTTIKKKNCVQTEMTSNATKHVTQLTSDLKENATVCDLFALDWNDKSLKHLYFFKIFRPKPLQQRNEKIQ